MTRMQVIAAVVALCAVGFFVYEMLPLLRPAPRPNPRLLHRLGRSTVIRVPERVPSAGLAWSKTHYPEEYAPENWVSVEFTGLDDSEKERFLDIGAQAYSRELVGNFSYTDPAAKRPRVRLEYLRRGETLIGKLSGDGLKPNFAYQIKLRGRFADRAAFERIGYLGRWRLPGRGTNYRDAAYRAFPYPELVESYLLFDFFVTDPQGRIEKLLYADSTLHVLWNFDNQRVPAASDSRPVEYSREGTNRALYSNPRADLSPQKIFAESEEHSLAPRNRPPINEAFLRPGRYDAEIVLTEESFHGYGANGFWATVMSAPVEFEVIDRPRPSPYWQALEPEGLRLSLASAEKEDLTPDVCTDTLLTGEAGEDGPAITFAEPFTPAPGRRRALALELRAAGWHAWQIFVDQPDEPSRKPFYVIESDGTQDWQRFEVEITRAPGGILRVVPTLEPGPIGVRNVGIYRIRE